MTTRVFVAPLALAFILTMTGTPRPAQMPWTTFSGDMVQAHTGIPIRGMCMQGTVEILRFRYKDAQYVLAMSESSPVVVFAYDPNPEDIDVPYTEVGIGRLDVGNTDVIPPLTWEPYAEKHKNVCALLFPEAV